MWIMSTQFSKMQQVCNLSILFMKGNSTYLSYKFVKFRLKIREVSS